MRKFPPVTSFLSHYGFTAEQEEEIDKLYREFSDKCFELRIPKDYVAYGVSANAKAYAQSVVLSAYKF